MLTPALGRPLPDRAIDNPAYQSALAYLYAFSPRAVPSSETLADRPRKLPRMRGILDRLGNPERDFDAVLIAGTKGKGSTAAMLESIARAADYATGLYTQPHLHSWCERIRLDGRPIEPNEVVELTGTVASAVVQLDREAPELGRPTTFEVGTAVAFLAFAQRHVRLAVVEVGVGGARDATNVFDPLVVALAPIGLDHTETLGDSLAKIAEEKAGLLRPGGSAVVGLQPPEALAVVERIASERGAHLEQLGRDWFWVSEEEHPGRGVFSIEDIRRGERFSGLSMPLLGRHQRDNATLAVAAARTLGHVGVEIGVDAVRRGLADVSWPGRIQVLHERPWVVADGAHNVDSALRLVEALGECFPHRRLHLVLGMTEGKDVAAVLDALLPAADRLTVTQSTHYRALAAQELAHAVVARGVTPRVAPDVRAALQQALGEADAADLICVTGSLFVAAEAIEANDEWRVMSHE